MFVILQVLPTLMLTPCPTVSWAEDFTILGFENEFWRNKYIVLVWMLRSFDIFCWTVWWKECVGCLAGRPDWLVRPSWIPKVKWLLRNQTQTLCTSLMTKYRASSTFNDPSYLQKPTSTTQCGLTRLTATHKIQPNSFISIIPILLHCTGTSF